MKSRVAITIFGFPIYWYGVFIALGMLLAVLVMFRREQRLGLPKDISIDLLLWTIPIAIVCARVYYVAFAWDAFRDDPWSVFNLRLGGLAIYGGVLGGFAVLYLYAKVKKLPLGSLLDLGAPSLALGQALGRWGNFANQEAYGDAVSHAWQAFFPLATYIEADGAWHYATFFYESAWCVGIVAAILLAERKGAFRRKGDVFLWYVILYGAERAFVESLRTDSLYWGSIRVSQLLSACAVAVVLILFLLRGRSKTKWLGAAGAACALISAFVASGWARFALLAVALVAAIWVYRGGDADVRRKSD